MNKPTTTLAMLLEQVESEITTANGRTVRLCRDPRGNYWVVDDAERVMSLSAFVAECNDAAREFAAQARAEAFRQFVAGAREAAGAHREEPAARRKDRPRLRRDRLKTKGRPQAAFSLFSERRSS